MRRDEPKEPVPHVRGPDGEWIDVMPWSVEPLEDGEPCGHPGCLNHVTHPCEGCGRIAGKAPLPKG